jgi:hypothetical protein
VKAALKSKVPWTEVMEMFELSLAEIMEISGKMDGLPARKDDLLDARDEPKTRGGLRHG